MPTFSTPGPVAATVQVAGARVRVTASDRDDTVVQVEPIDPSRRTDVKVADRTRVELTDGRLSVKTTTSGSKDGSVAITIDLPSRSSLVAYLGHSDLQVVGPLGDCELHTATASVQLERVAALRANMSAGDVAIDHLAGRAEVDGRVVALRIGRADGPVGVSSSSGQVRIGRALADVDLRSGASGLDVDQVDGSVSAQTGDGAIRIGHLKGGRAELMNGRGDIEVGIDRGAAARVHATSERGSVHDAVTADGGTADGAFTVDARSRHGDVTVRWADPQGASAFSTS